MLREDTYIKNLTEEAFFRRQQDSKRHKVNKSSTTKTVHIRNTDSVSGRRIVRRHADDEGNTRGR